MEDHDWMQSVFVSVQWE